MKLSDIIYMVRHYEGGPSLRKYKYFQKDATLTTMEGNGPLDTRYTKIMQVGSSRLNVFKLSFCC